MPRDKNKVTIYDVAEYANVAISTVSRVLNNSADVSDHTREKVLKAISELQFRPDRIAKSLAQQKSTTLAVAIPSFTTPYHNELLKGVRAGLQGEPIDLLLCDLGSKEPHSTLRAFLNRGTVDGLLLAGVVIDDELAEELAALRAPVVIIGSSHPGFDSFFWDNELGAYEAVSHLIHMGHRDIALLRTHMEASITQNARTSGYLKALKEAGLPVREELMVSGTTEKHAGFSEESGLEATVALLDSGVEFTSIFACSDVQAIGAAKALRDRDVRVPEDVAIIGYDNIKTSEYIGLSSVDQQMRHIGLEATQLLMERTKHEGAYTPALTTISPKLHIRTSSRFQRQ
ncbi:MAG: LacI family DNA-binding transcriptional regulator [Rhodothermales bacterium]